MAIGAGLAVVGFQLWISPSNPPGFIRDEASFAYNAYTISRNLHDQDGGFLPLYFVSFHDYKSPLFVYLLAAVFRLTGPNAEVARGVAAACVLAAVLLVGLIAYRRTRSVAVAAGIVVLAGITPWLFELGRVAYDAALQPLAVAVLLLALDWAYRSKRGALVRALPVGLALGVLTYSYAAGRLLAPLFALALVVFAGRGRWRWLGATWAVFAATWIPLALYWHNHPGALKARWQETTFIRAGMSTWEKVRDAVSNYVHDLNLWHWVTSGDPKPYVHTWGAGQLFATTCLLALLGAVVIIKRRPLDRWWLYVLVLLALVPIPSALTEDRFNAVRLALLPLMLAVVAIPGLQVLLEAVRTRWSARALAVVLAVLVAAQFQTFLHWYTVRGPSRTQLFEAGVPPLLARAFAHGQTVYIDYDDRYAQTHALWYAVTHGLPRTRVSILPDGGIPPPGSMVFGRVAPCDYICPKLGRSYDYWIARAVGPKPS
jgi:4-amino-4-deoxy-L-arabinose transferase-like glycosyltransferase